MGGPAPKQTRRRRNAPALGEWIPAPGSGWQHGAVPEPPDGLLAATRAAWTTWFQAWFAVHWIPADLPGLTVLIRQFDVIERGQAKANDVTATVRLMDNYGITPAGQQARRWNPPKADEPPAAEPGETPAVDPRFARLRAV